LEEKWWAFISSFLDFRSNEFVENVIGTRTFYHYS